MGALTDHRKRRYIEQRVLLESPSPPPKKSKLFTNPVPPHPAAMTDEGFSGMTSNRVGLEKLDRPAMARTQFNRPIHAPQRILTAFGLGSRAGNSRSDKKDKDREESDDSFSFGFRMNEQIRAKGVKRDAWGLSDNVDFVDLTESHELGVNCSQSGVKLNPPDLPETSVSGSEFRVSKVAKKNSEPGFGFSKALRSRLGLPENSKKVFGSELGFSEAIEIASPVSPEMVLSKDNDLSLKQYKKLVSSVSNLSEVRVLSKKVPLYKELYDQSVKEHGAKLKDLEFEVKLAETELNNFKLLREILDSKPKQDTSELFVLLTDEEQREVDAALNGRNRGQVLVAHEPSNIEISREKLQCLKFGAWLNDEVINLYLELLKERERRDPKKFLKCHFFNTFFFKKLAGGKSGYDFRAVKRWTTQKKLGYSLIECDKIFVPIHKEVHWCLAVINVRDKKIQYLDSLGSLDTMSLRVLGRYFAEEVKDKSGKQIDISSWETEEVPDLPLQENGWDCGMFMLKYIDFLSRDLGLSFSQEHMNYFRKRTAKELLRLRAE